jgi:hypothetical protein
MQANGNGTPGRARRTIFAGAAVALAGALVISACGGGGDTGTSASGSRTIQQPSLAKLPKITQREVAPESRRVDLEMPTFSNPTAVTNPLFPVSDIHSSILHGRIPPEPPLRGGRLKVEVTLLPETKAVDWNGQRIEARQSQFIAYLNGRILEAAVDLYAQADDGAVWYLGEDVVDYENGVAATSEGTWRVGVNGPGAMIMPSDPKVGDVFRTENIPGRAFEQVTVKTLNKTVESPTGPVKGAMVGTELHTEGDYEPKTFAPGYAELHSGSPGDFEANALTVPVDALPGATPSGLSTLSSGAEEVAAAAQSKDWPTASDTLNTMNSAWDAYRPGGVPKRLGAQMTDDLKALSRTVDSRSQRGAQQAALDVDSVSLDLQLRYRPPSEIDRARFDLWARRLALDANAKNAGAVSGDVTTLAWIRDRIALDPADANLIDDQLRLLRSVAAASVADAKEFKVAAAEATQLRENLRRSG